MKIILVLVTLFFAQKAFAQQTDTIWYNSKWEKTLQVSERHYLRIIEKLSSNKYKIKDYYETGTQQMKGYFSAVDPDVKEGVFKYWYRNGKKQMDATYESNVEIQVCQYNELGEITNEWERIPVVKFKHGERVTEYRVLQRSPKFPGGKEALEAFIKNNIKYSEGSSRKGQVVVQFKIDVEGKTKNVSVLSGLSQEQDQEAIDLIRKMPNWEPGKQNGQLVEITLSLSINFD